MCNLQVELLTAARAFSCCKKDPALKNLITCCSCMKWESFAYIQTVPGPGMTPELPTTAFEKRRQESDNYKACQQCHFTWESVPVSVTLSVSAGELLRLTEQRQHLIYCALHGVGSEEQKTWIREHCKGCCNYICSLNAASSQVKLHKGFCSALEMRKTKVWVPTDLRLTLVRVRNVMMEKEHLIHRICSLRG